MSVLAWLPDQPWLSGVYPKTGQDTRECDGKTEKDGEGECAMAMPFCGHPYGVSVAVLSRVGWALRPPELGP